MFKSSWAWLSFCWESSICSWWTVGKPQPPPPTQALGPLERKACGGCPPEVSRRAGVVLHGLRSHQCTLESHTMTVYFLGHQVSLQRSLLGWS